MPGFFITNSSKAPALHNYADANCVRGSMVCGNWHIAWNVLDKYMDDKVFWQDGECILLLDGVILNKRDLLLSGETWTDALCRMRKTPEWFRALRGSFSGAVFDKASGHWTCFTDPCGAHLLMTCCAGGFFACGSQINYFSRWMTENHLEKRVDPQWQQDILTFGFMREAYTVLSGVTRIYPGHYVLWDGNGVSEHCYHRATKHHPATLSAPEAIEKLDSVFTQAIRRITEKDREYGYRTLVDVSGGLDSRMNASVACREAGSQILGITYAQSGSDDQRIASRVARRLGMEHRFFPMDGGDFLKEIDALEFMNNGFNDYFGITAGKQVLESLDFSKTGAEIWGLLGDIYEGGMVSDTGPELKWTYDRYNRSHRFPTPGAPKHPHAFEDNELMWFYVRGMLAGMNTGLIRQNFTEPLTPYGDVEFMDLVFSLSEDLRFRQHIFRQWMMQRYPKMAKIPYSGTGAPLLPGEWDRWPVRLRYYRRRFYQKFFGFRPQWSMNPIAQWYAENPGLRSAIDGYFAANRQLPGVDPAFAGRVEQLFREGNITEKLLAVSVLSAVKQFVWDESHQK